MKIFILIISLIILSSYRQGSGKYYDDSSFWFRYFNLHFFHIQIGPAYRYRDSINSSIVCISCHNLHGSDTPWGSLYDEMQFMHYTVSGDEFGTMDLSNYSQLSNFPTSCSFNCHMIQGKTYSWFEPSGE